MTMRCAVASLFFAISSLISPAWSTSFSTDQSDLWWNANESGWGIQFVQRGSIIFATMFVYDQFGIPIWYVATMNNVGGLVWTGDLLLTAGPWFGTVPFNPNTVTFRKVGTMTWSASTVSAGTLNYSVDGVFVAKNLVRQLLVLDNYSGHYGGALHSARTGCANPGFNGTAEGLGVLDVTHSGSTINVHGAFSNGATCSYAGTYSQAGQFGAIAGTYACSDGDSGNFQAFEMQINITGFTGRYVSTSNAFMGCQGTGWFGGLHVTTF